MRELSTTFLTCSVFYLWKHACEVAKKMSHLAIENPVYNLFQFGFTKENQTSKMFLLHLV